MGSVKLLSLFSGIGAFEKALTKLGINYNLVGFSEVDKYAIQSYCAVHGVSSNLNLGDVSTINSSKLSTNIDIITHGSPCQSFSVAGSGHGGDKGSGTRSSLMWETVRIVGEIKPKYVIWENVKGVLNQKNIHNFDLYLRTLEELGYNSHWQVLNALDYNIPQNRERIFVVSIKKDIDTNTFKFGQPTRKSLILEDFLDKEVDSKYLLSQKHYDNFFKNKEYNTNAHAKAIRNGVYDIIGTTLSTGAKGTNSRHWVYDTNKTVSTLDATMYKQPKQIYIKNYPQNNDTTRPVIRKLTPLECWRLMGFDDTDYYKAKTRLEEVFYNNKDKSDTQMYRQAGNSIVVPVLESIFSNLFLHNKN